MERENYNEGEWEDIDEGEKRKGREIANLCQLYQGAVIEQDFQTELVIL